MAYVFEFAFLCNFRHKAEKIKRYLSASSNGIGWQKCSIYIESHKDLTLDCCDPNLCWVSVVPITEKNKIKWASGSPDVHDREANIFKENMFSRLSNWPPELEFLFAAAGVEISG